MTGVDIGVFVFPAGGTTRPAPWSQIAVRAVDAKGRKVDIEGGAITVHTTTSIDGSLAEVTLIDLVPTDGTYCYEWVIEGPDNLSLKIYTLMPNSSTPIAFADLPRVRRSDFQSAPEVEAAWEATARLATEASEEARAAAQDAADAVAGIEQKIDDEISAHMSELRGADAYEVAVQEGFVGTREQWLESLHGQDGRPGDDGASAYQLAVAAGFVGTEAQWRASLKGADGANPTPQSYGDALTAAGPARTAAQQIASDKVDEKRGAAGGVAPLGSDSRVPDGNLPVRLSTSGLRQAFVTVRTADGQPLPAGTVVVITIDKTLAQVTANPVADIADITFETGA